MRVSALVTLCLLSLICCLSCASVAVLENWEKSGYPTTVKLNAPVRSPDNVQLGWSSRAQLPYSPDRIFNFDPELTDCSSVEIFATSSDGIHPEDPRDLVLTGFDREPSDAIGEAWEQIGDSPCAVLLLVGTSVGQLAPRLHVSTTRETVGTVRLETERNHWWLSLFPLGVAVDAGGLSILYAAYSCVMPAPGNLCLAWLDAAY